MLPGNKLVGLMDEQVATGFHRNLGDRDKTGMAVNCQMPESVHERSHFPNDATGLFRDDQTVEFACHKECIKTPQCIDHKCK